MRNILSLPKPSAGTSWVESAALVFCRSVSRECSVYYDMRLEIEGSPEIRIGGGSPVPTADAQKLMGGVDASGNLRVLDNIVDAQGNPVLVPGIGIDLDRFCSWLPDKDVPGLSLAAHKGSHPGFTGAVADKLGDIGFERAARIRRAVASLTEPDDIAEAIISANRVAEEQVLQLQGKIRRGLAKPQTLHRDAGHTNSETVYRAWLRLLQ